MLDYGQQQRGKPATFYKNNFQLQDDDYGGEDDMDDDYGGYYAEDSDGAGAQDDSGDQYYPPSAMFQGQKTNVAQAQMMAAGMKAAGYGGGVSSASGVPFYG